MCGICGIVASDPNYRVVESSLLAMRERLVHRGPDDAGHYIGPGVGLASRRLAILDLSRHGQMPMSTPEGRYQIVYNGEVYNYRDLRRMLEVSGYKFRSNTDTEVVLYLYAAEGPAMLDRLNGMFSIGIWDTQKRRLFLARDRLGIKPLYYAYDKAILQFASEEKALFAGGISPIFDHNSWEELLCFRYVAGEHTPFLGVDRILPGHYMVWEHGRVTIRQWWNLGKRVRARRDELANDPISWYRETFDNAVGQRRISDVPVGVLLSGGLDSSSIAASLAGQADSQVSSFTVRFAEADYDEGPLAQQVVERWQLDGHELCVDPADLPTKLYRASWLNDEPLAHGNDLYLLEISRHAKSHVKVLLSGEGADEVLGGYVRYQPLRYPNLLSFIRPFWQTEIASRFKGRVRKLRRFMELGALDRFVLFNACDVLPEDLRLLGLSGLRHQFDYREHVLAEAQDLYPYELVRQAMYSDHHTFLCSLLDRNDRMTMGASIECRVPFLDYRLVETVAAMPSSWLFSALRGKRLLKAATGHRLPSDLLTHRKWGFGVPWKRYLREIEGFRTLLNDLPRCRLVLDSPLQPNAVEKQVRAFFKGDDQPLPLLMELLMIVVAWESVKATESIDFTPSHYFAPKAIAN